MFELFLVLTVAGVGLRAFGQVYRSPHFPWRRVVSNLAALLLFAAYLLLGIAALMKGMTRLPALAPALRSQEAYATLFVVFYLAWLGVGLYGLIRYSRADRRRWENRQNLS